MSVDIVDLPYGRRSNAAKEPLISQKEQSGNTIFIAFSELLSIQLFITDTKLKIDSGREGPNRYQVLERKKVIYVNDGNPQPRNGKVIGHVVDGVFVPVIPKEKHDEACMLSYGVAAFVHSVSSDILEDLLF